MLAQDGQEACALVGDWIREVRAEKRTSLTAAEAESLESRGEEIRKLISCRL